MRWQRGVARVKAVLVTAALVVAALASAGVLVVWLGGYLVDGGAEDPPRPAAASLDLQSLLGGSDATAADYTQALPGRALRFPDDHAPHPDFRNEWWYLNGHLQSAAGERFGFQFTLFRLAQRSPSALASENPWLSGQVYLGHLALTSLNEDEHRAAERLTRAGPQLAGGQPVPPKIWLGSWMLQAENDSELFPLRLSAEDHAQGIGLRLQLQADKPRILQGQDGWSQKNAAGGGSYYYSYTRLSAEGLLRWDERQIPVRGQAWYDHEWSSNSLAAHQQGWDWFALQLDDGRELMLYRFRNRDDTPGWSQALLVTADGRRQPLASQQWALQVLSEWQSPAGRTYPASWRLRVPSHGLSLQIDPLVADQEMRLALPYWEGAVRVRGSHSGAGYVELVGY